MVSRVLIITPGFYPLFGGMEEQCYLLAKAFMRLGYEVDILTEQTKPDFAKREKLEGIKIYRLPYVEQRDLFGFFKLFWEMVCFLRKNSKKYNFCIIRTLTFHCLVVGFLKCCGLKLRTVVTAETGGKNDDIVALKKSPFWRLYVFLANKHDHLNAICEDNVRHYRELGFDMKKVGKIYNGIDSGMYKKSNYPQKIRNFMFLGRLVRTKGIFELVRAFKLVLKKRPMAKLYIGGDGVDKEMLLKIIENDKDNIVYCGYIEKAKKEDFFNKVDCMILPSYSEGFPVSVLEAAVRKKIILSTNVSDLKSFFGSNIIFCRKRDYKDLAQKIMLLIDSHYGSKINYDDVVGRVTIENVTKTYRDLFLN